MRVHLTKKKAEGLKAARVQAGKSQYELANELGWVRSKIKRLEKGEVQTIDESDLKALEQKLAAHPDVQEVKIFREGIGKARSSSKSEFFEEVAYLADREASPGGVNCAFFRVRMRKTMIVRELMGVELELEGRRGRIHGIEHVGADLLRAGTVIDIMLWAPGIAA